MGRHKGTITPEHKEIMRQKAKREWADPILRARRMAAMRSFDHAAIVAAALAKPKRLYKQIAYDFQINRRYLQTVLRNAGISRNASSKQKRHAGQRKAAPAPANDQQHQESA